MYHTLKRITFGLLTIAIVAGACDVSAGVTPGDVGIDPRPIVFKPEPVGKLHPKVSWLKTDRVRALWGAQDLYDSFGTMEGVSSQTTTDKTKAQVMAESGFNVAIIGMQNDPKNRTTVPGFDDVLPANIKEAHKHGLALWIKWRYGSDHQDPYHRYRAPHGELAEKSCCPLDSQYIERHFGRWAVKIAEAGADGFILDTEMYLSDLADYYGPCVCDYCFRTYIDEFNTKGADPYDTVQPADRGVWLREHGIFGHYTLFAARRVEDLYDSIRARCQAANPAFVFGYAPTIEHIPGITRGLGTSSVPCLLLGEAEYTTGPTSLMIHDLDYFARSKTPGMYICGLYVSQTSPEQMAERALIASLYGDGWWAWYGAALLNYVGPGAEKTAMPGGYGRWGESSAHDYLDRLTEAHAQVDELASKPRDTWPAYPTHPDMAPPPKGTIAPRQGDINIDGALDDAGWKNASRFDLDTDRYAKKHGPANVFWFCWDKEALYFAATCPIPEGTKLSVPSRGRDHPYAWLNDGMELFFDPTGTGAGFAQFVLSPLGDVYDSRVDFAPGSRSSGNLDWNPAVKIGTATTDAQYIIEIRIPFDEFLPAPSADDSWGVNVCRAKPTVQTWSPTFGIFHNAPRFGTMTFAAPPRSQP